jgi:hypothetical protein
METMRESWTDERLDDLRDEMHRGFARVDTDLRELRSEMNTRFSGVDTRFNSIDARFDSMHRTMVIGFATIGGGLLASIAATVLAAVLS